MKSILRRLHYEWMYLARRPPWDTNITPPEVLEFLTTAEPGRALDLGCGTGTNAITMAQHGWKVTGIDFSNKAIQTARRKAAKLNLEIDFFIGDVTDLGFLTEFYDYVLDIGCLHSILEPARSKYAHGLKRLLRPGGLYMLYAWQPRRWGNAMTGLTVEQVNELFSPALFIQKTTAGEDQGAGSAWYWLIRN
ncbi:MAG: class I SAM-dependent methyltransferase [Anaerolineales bacterium]|nr:class I SAM-dependent methyltransferase [Anaerolineales bacterium]